MSENISGHRHKKVLLASSGVDGGRGASEHPRIPRKAPAVKNCLAQNVNSAVVPKPCT